jgi:Ala-tRNA(Pro) deacylase
MLTLRGIPYEELHHPDAYTAQQVAQYEHVSGHRVAKVVVVIADEFPVELILPASRRIVLETVRKVLRADEVRLAGEDELEKYFADCEVGAVPALRHWSCMPVYMDTALNVEGDIVFQAATHTDAVRLKFQDWYALVKPQIASFSQPVELAPA